MRKGHCSQYKNHHIENIEIDLCMWDNLNRMHNKMIHSDNTLQIRLGQRFKSEQEMQKPEEEHMRVPSQSQFKPEHE